MSRKMIIIGAGISGLSVGCYGRMNGYQTHILEHHTLPGGLCTAWKREGFTIDGCIHWLMGSRPGSPLYRVYRELGAFADGDIIALTHFATMVDEEEGWQLDVTWDLDRLERDLLRLAPEDRAVIRELLAGVRKASTIPVDLPVPGEFRTRLESLQGLWTARGVILLMLRYMMTTREFADRKVKSPVLHRVLTRLLLPEIPTAFWMTTIGHIAGGGMGRIRGGSLRFARSIADRYRALGGEVTYGARVEQILVQGDRAVGVRLADGTELRADLVVSAADGHSTIFELLEGRYVDDRVRERFDTWPRFPAILLLSYGVADPCRGVTESFNLRLRRPLESVRSPRPRALGLRVMNFDDTLTPEGKTVVQAVVEADWDQWWSLQQADHAAYDRLKQRVSDEVLDRISGYLPDGAADKVEMTDVATPCTLWRYTRNHRGAFEGWLPTPAALRAGVRRTLPGLGGFYMVGQWVDPGGGIPPAVYAGRHLVAHLCRQEGRPFRVSMP
jgi:phytoene dehydrogenase-like protein